MTTVPDVKTTIEWLPTPSGVQLYTKTWHAQPSPRALLFFIHGFTEYIERYDHIFPLFAAEGVEVFAFDQRGFGKTAHQQPPPGKGGVGQTSWPEQFGDIALLIQRFAASHDSSLPLFLMGHSMGGGLSLGTVTRSPPIPLPPLAGVISCSPLIRQAHPVWGVTRAAGMLVARLTRTMTVRSTVDPKLVCRDPKIQAQFATDKLCDPVGTLRGVGDMLTGGINLATKDYKRFPSSLPLLIIHGDADEVTSCAASEQFVRDCPSEDKTFKSYPGHFHELFQEPEEDKFHVARDVLGWVLERVSKKESGAREGEREGKVDQAPSEVLQETGAESGEGSVPQTSKL